MSPELKGVADVILSRRRTRWLLFDWLVVNSAITGEVWEPDISSETYILFDLAGICEDDLHFSACADLELFPNLRGVPQVIDARFGR